MASHPNSQKQRVPVWRRLPLSQTIRMINARKFLTRHDKLLTFIGALIVFATFIAHEQIGESLKEAVDLWKSAQSLYAISQTMLSSAIAAGDPTNEAQAALTHFQQMQDKLEAGQISEEQGIDAAATMLLSNTTTRLTIRGLHVLDYQLSQLVPLTENLQDGKAKRQQIESLQKIVTSLTIKWSELPRLSPSDSGKTKKEKIVAAIDKFASIVPDSMDIANLFPPLLSSIVGGIETNRKNAEEKYQTSKKVTLWLWVLGWGLGLVGKICGLGVEGVAG